MHRLDAELTAGTRTPMDPVLCLDGVDEALRVTPMGLPALGHDHPRGGPHRATAVPPTPATDWLLTLARFTGTDPDDGTSYDEPDIHTATDPGTEPDVVVERPARPAPCSPGSGAAATAAEVDGHRRPCEAYDRVPRRGQPPDQLGAAVEAP